MTHANTHSTPTLPAPMRAILRALAALVALDFDLGAGPTEQEVMDDLACGRS